MALSTSEASWKKAADWNQNLLAEFETLGFSSIFPLSRRAPFAKVWTLERAECSLPARNGRLDLAEPEETHRA